MMTVVNADIYIARWRIEHTRYIDSFEQNAANSPMRERFPLATRLGRTLLFGHRHRTVPLATTPKADQSMEGSMQLRAGLNIAAAIMSFAFLAAVVLGVL
jgi:hypothetical protein